MFKEERQTNIIDILKKEKKVIDSNLSQRLEVSEDTIRRDLIELDKQGKLKRVHSGALRVGPPITDFTYRTNIDSDIKQEISLKALSFLKEDSVIIIDGSTTNLVLVKSLPLEFRSTIITNSPPIAIELANRPNIKVINLGGNFYKRSMINLGVETYKSLQNFRADLYVMGIYNIDIDSGTSVPTIQEAEIKKEMVNISNKVLGMITGDKFETISNTIVGPVEDLNFLISSKIPKEIKKIYSKTKVLLID